MKFIAILYNRGKYDFLRTYAMMKREVLPSCKILEGFISNNSLPFNIAFK